MRSPRLATVFAVRLALVVGLAMAAYAAAELSRDPGASRWDLAATHAWHVAALGVLLYATLLFGFERTIAAPLRRVHAHLYRVATGKLELLELPPSAREVEEIVSSVNLMVRRMRLGWGDPEVQRAAGALRDVARRVGAGAASPEDAQLIFACAAVLESALVPPVASRQPQSQPSPPQSLARAPAGS